MRTRTFFLAAACTLALGACNPAETPRTATETAKSETETAAPIITYTDAFVMEPIAGRDMTMGGVTLSVTGADTRLVAASSPAFGAIELHSVRMADGKMQMRQVDGFDIAAGDSIALKRGGDHFMMFDVSDAVMAGETVDITLEFDTGGEETLKRVVPANVRRVGE